MSLDITIDDYCEKNWCLFFGSLDSNSIRIKASVNRFLVTTNSFNRVDLVSPASTSSLYLKDKAENQSPRIAIAGIKVGHLLDV